MCRVQWGEGAGNQAGLQLELVLNLVYCISRHVLSTHTHSHIQIRRHVRAQKCQNPYKHTHTYTLAVLNNRLTGCQRPLPAPRAILNAGHNLASLHLFIIYYCSYTIFFIPCSPSHSVFLSLSRSLSFALPSVCSCALPALLFILYFCIFHYG